MVRTLSKWLPKVRNNHFFVLDAIIFLLTPLFALAIRLDSWIAFASYLPSLWITILLFTGIKLLLLYKLGFYRRCWRYASVDELVTTILFAAIVIVLQTTLLSVLNAASIPGFNRLPYSLSILDGILSCFCIGGVRFSIRFLERFEQQFGYSVGYRTLIVGAGMAGVTLAQQMQQDFRLGFRPTAFVDDDPAKRNLRIRGIPVLGNRTMIPEIVRTMKIRKIIIALPSAPGYTIREILDICRSTGVQTSSVPGIHEILNEQVRVDNLRDVQIEDLLRREPITTDIHKVAKLLKGKRVLITGAGGSIGSELCRQVLRFKPAELILLGKGENSLFNIHQELSQILQTSGQADEAELSPHLTVFVSDIRCVERLEYAFEIYRPEIIFHAAAHKHVPLMELNAPEAVTTNIQGTQNLLDLALRWNTEHFVMISTDKAVNPSSVMGASKRVAEMLVLQAAKTSNKPYVAVRFGNVLGSRGSVVPVFQKQIAAGGPVTVTHPDVRRYFMTIPEAVQLVLQAAVLGRGEEVFMLDMGQPVKIADLAQDLIRLSGYEVGKDIEIVYTGMRPGEKLFEELLIQGEQYERTKHEKILIVRNASRTVPAKLPFGIEVLRKAAANNDSKLIHFMMEQCVAGYTPDHASAQTIAPRIQHPVTVQV